MNSENVLSAANQQGSRPVINWIDPSETTRQAPLLEAYFMGASHDGTSNRLHKTYRISQKTREWLELLQYLLGGSRS